MRTLYTSREAWAIWSPYMGLTHAYGDTRADAIIGFLSWLSHECQDARRNPPDGIGTALLPIEQRTWRRLRKEGFMAVHVIVQVADHRVRQPA